MSVRTTLALLLLATGACHVPPPSLPLESWSAPVETDHPLVGQVYDVRSGELVTPAELEERIQYSQFVLLGEKHDNPDHHRVQAAVLSALLRDGARPALVLEMITTEQQADLDRALADPEADAAAIARALAWDESGWPDFAMYEPIFTAALAAKLPIAGANLPRREVAAVAHGGAVIGPEAPLLEEPFDDDVRARLDEMLAASHCHHAPPKMIASMSRVQRARDARFAATLAARGAERGAVLIAGAEHVRRDYGVPWYLEKLVPGAATTVVAPVEVMPDVTEPTAYLRGAGEPIFDFFYFTPRIDSEDPCERFREQLERMKAEKRAPTARRCTRPRGEAKIEL